MPDMTAVHKLFRDYLWAADHTDLELASSVFTEDGSFTIDIRGGSTLGPVEGRQAILDFIKTTRDSEGDVRFHLFTNLDAEDVGDEIKASAITIILRIDEGAAILQTAGIYRADIVQESGKHLIRKLHLQLETSF